MKKQLLTLQELIGVMDPELYRHLGSSYQTVGEIATDSVNREN